jgi:hypothetical protein
MMLQTSVFDEVFTYGIEAMWRTYFAHLRRTAGNDVGGQFGPSSVSMSAGSGAPPAKLEAPAWELVFVDAPGAVD